MFNLVVRSFDWNSNRGSIDLSRIFEYTEDHVAERFKEGASILLEKLRALPCLFMPEGLNDEEVRIGFITNLRVSGRQVLFEYTLDNETPPFTSSFVYNNRVALDMADFEFSRNHWAVKEIDLYRFLLRSVRPRRQRPIVFQIAEHERIEATLSSAMMPFDASFNAVYESIKEASELAGLRCRRADDIWENAAIIQDVVALIDRSQVVVCDCTGRNPNVFYEAGIAHTLGRHVILITQSEHDIPFDLRHLRHIRYLNNAEGRGALKLQLQAKMTSILGH